MRFENGKPITLEQDIERIWELHGWEVVEEKLPRSPNFERTHEATWIIKAKHGVLKK